MSILPQILVEDTILAKEIFCDKKFPKPAESGNDK